MKKLLIIVPKDTILNSYLLNQFAVYDKIIDLEDRVCYKITGLSVPMETINYLISMFLPLDFSIKCNYGDYTFRVRS